MVVSDVIEKRLPASIAWVGGINGDWVVVSLELVVFCVSEEFKALSDAVGELCSVSVDAEAVRAVANRFSLRSARDNLKGVFV